jgi:SAM-dependent methyltransferase
MNENSSTSSTDTERMDANRANWEDRVPIHTGAGGYGVENLAADPARLSGTVAHDAAALGDVRGLRVAHLQCHIGTDTLSLTRLGAECVGLDFSPSALAVARELAASTGAPMTFVEASVYDAVAHLGAGRFDIVYSTVGTIFWLPDIDRWAVQVAGLLKPGGRLYLREMHPILFAVDETRMPGEVVLRYPYTQRAGFVSFDESHTYTGEGVVENSRTYEWNHSIAEIVSALINAGLRITAMADEETMEWSFYEGQPEVSPGRWGVPSELSGLIPLMLRVEAVKN